MINKLSTISGRVDFTHFWEMDVYSQDLGVKTFSMFIEKVHSKH